MSDIKLYNSDCFEIIKTIPKNNNYVIVTDPPFNVGYHYNSYNDNKDDNDYYEWLASIFEGVFSGLYSLSRIIV